MNVLAERLADLTARAKASDAEIDFSDIPELDARFFDTARLVEPDQTEHVTLQMKIRGGCP